MLSYNDYIKYSINIKHYCMMPVISTLVLKTYFNVVLLAQFIVFQLRQFLFDSRCRRVNNNLPPIQLTL